MLSIYRSAIYWFITVTAILILGFYFTYFSRFPVFEGLSWAHHFHGILFFLWMLLMVAQPMLIAYKKVAVHQFIGKISYLLMPLLLISIHLMSKSTYSKSLAEYGREAALGAIAISIPVIPILGLLYVLAIYNSKKTAHHMRYMIGISILLLGPGLGRAIIVLGHLPFPVGVCITNAIATSISAILLIRECITSKVYMPYVITFISTVILSLCWNDQMNEGWQFIASAYAKAFF